MLVDVVGEERAPDPEVPLHEQELRPRLAPVRWPIHGWCDSLVHLVDDDGRDPLRRGSCSAMPRSTSVRLGPGGGAAGAGIASRQPPRPTGTGCSCRRPTPAGSRWPSRSGRRGCWSCPAPCRGHEDGRLAGVEAEICPGHFRMSASSSHIAPVVFLGQGAQPRPVASSSSRRSGRTSSWPRDSRRSSATHRGQLGSSPGRSDPASSERRGIDGLPPAPARREVAVRRVVVGLAEPEEPAVVQIVDDGLLALLGLERREVPARGLAGPRTGHPAPPIGPSTGSGPRGRRKTPAAWPGPPPAVRSQTWLRTGYGRSSS